jgi:hypothetical protein
LLALQVFGGDKNRTRKISDLQHTLGALEAAQQAGTAEYERVKTRNLQELTRFKAEKKEDFHNMLVSPGNACLRTQCRFTLALASKFIGRVGACQVGFARVQAAFAERSFNVWMGVAEEFGMAAELADKLSA